MSRMTRTSARMRNPIQLPASPAVVCVHMHNLHVLSPRTSATRMLCCTARVGLSVAWCLVRRCSLHYKFSLSHELRRKSDELICRSFLFTDLEKNLSSPTLVEYHNSTMDDISLFVTGGFHARSSGMRVYGLGTSPSAPSLHPVGSPPPQSLGGQCSSAHSTGLCSQQWAATQDKLRHRLCRVECSGGARAEGAPFS